MTSVRPRWSARLGRSESQLRSRADGERRPSSEPFDSYAPRWLALYGGRTSRGFSDNARREYHRALRLHAIPFFQSKCIDAIEPCDVREFVAHLEQKGLRRGTIVKYLTPVKALLATAWEDGSIKRHPAYSVRVAGAPWRDHEAQRVMTPTQCQRLLDALPPRWRLFHRFLLETGLRVSEALGLDWSDVEVAPRSKIWIRRQHYRGATGPLKTRASRRQVPLSTELADQLRQLRCDAIHEPVFATRNGTRHWERNIRRVLMSAAAKEGLDWVGFHTFRHTCAAVLFASGKTPLQVSRWLGHSDPAFTMRTYAHLIDPGLGSAECFNAIWDR
jgi:integrase